MEPAHDSAETLIEVQNGAVASLRHPEVIVLEQVNWTICRGDFWVVAGLQGAGKSDLLAMLAGLTNPAEGKYFFAGQEMRTDYSDEQAAERLRIGLVFDGGQLLNHLTVLENVALPLMYHRNSPQAGAQLDKLLDMTQLTGQAHRLPGAINRSARQRAGLARALTLQPEVLLLDNPLTGLDPREIGWWLRMCEQLLQGHEWLGGRPTTLIATADNLDPWRTRATRFAILHNRRLTVMGSRQEMAARALDLPTEHWPQEFNNQ